MPTAFITGVTGQDGAYLARYLLSLGYRVVGGSRRPKEPSANLEKMGIAGKVPLLKFEAEHEATMRSALEQVQPDEIYHLAAQSSIGRSFREPLLTAEATGLATARLLDAARLILPEAHFLIASSADIFGAVESWPQDESTPLRPQSPYGAAKAYSQLLASAYRQSYDMHVSCAILYNHESPLRHETFVTRKVSLAVARIKAGLQKELALGNLDVERDWGYAGDYVRAMHLMMQQEKPGDYIIATGKMHTLREFVDQAFSSVGLNYEDWVRIDPQFFRPVTEVALVGNPAKAERELGWKSEVEFHQLVELLVKADVEAIGDGKNLESLKLASV